MGSTDIVSDAPLVSIMCAFLFTGWKRDTRGYSPRTCTAEPTKRRIQNQSLKVERVLVYSLMSLEVLQAILFLFYRTRHCWDEVGV